MGEKKNYEYVPELLQKNLDVEEKLRNSVAPILEQEGKIQRIIDSSTVSKIEVSSTALETLKNIADNSAVRNLQNNTFIHTMGELALKASLQKYQFESPALKAIETWSNNAVKNMAAGLTALITNPVMQEIQSVTSNLGKWLQTVDFSPLMSILENIQDIGFDCDYEKVNEIFLKAMFDARWFPYAGWIADFRIVDAMLEVLDTSRASKNRVKRIDKLIFSYYDKEEINNLKRRWRQRNLPSYMTRILIQAVQAYYRREYALTVSALSTLWEGIIQEKVNDDSFLISRKTRENLTRLIEENEFDKIFSSFCEEFIFYNCNKLEDVKQDVPGRHGIAHCWYNTYPSRKMALNAIIFTDFLLELKPLEKTEE